jgi:hypothetical protein
MCKEILKGTDHRKKLTFKAVIQVAMGPFLTGKKITGLGSNSLKHRHQKSLSDWHF